MATDSAGEPVRRAAHPDTPTATVQEVDIRSELASRPPRRPDYAAEDRALTELAKEMAENPRNMLQKLVETAVKLCNADTAGISLLEGEVFRWEAIAGVFAAYRNGTMPREASPCGVCIDQNATQLMALADRAFPALLAEPRFIEALLLPFHFHGRPVGTVWIVAHTDERKFDREDERIVRTLADFASAGWQLWKACEAAEDTSRMLNDELVQQGKRLQALSRGILHAREDEARRIAHALHDESGQLLASVKLAVDEIRTIAAPTLASRFDRVAALLTETDLHLRRLSHELRPTILDDLGLGPALDWLAKGVSARSLVRITLEYEPTVRFPAHLETHLYRIVQEALSNMVRYSQTTTATVRLTADSERIVCTVRDNGIGFDARDVMSRTGDRGLGLIGIRERIQALGGDFAVETAPGAGTELRVIIPYDQREDRAPNTDRASPRP